MRGFLRATLGGGWMPPDQIAELLRCYGVPVVELTGASSEDEAVEAFRAAAGPVVLKADVPGLYPQGRRGRESSSTCAPRPRCEPPTAG